MKYIKTPPRVNANIDKQNNTMVTIQFTFETTKLDVNSKVFLPLKTTKLHITRVMNTYPKSIIAGKDTIESYVSLEKSLNENEMLFNPIIPL